MAIAARTSLSREEVKQHQKRFETKFSQSANDCWEWIGCGLSGKWKYGRFGIGKKNILAHRFSWILYIGEIPSGLFVCHHCDNPKCVNPSHLFLGSALDNHLDCKTKGRSKLTKGSKKGRKVKLWTEERREKRRTLKESDRIYLRKMRKYGLTYQELADKFSICPAVAWKIVNAE